MPVIFPKETTIKTVLITLGIAKPHSSVRRLINQGAIRRMERDLVVFRFTSEDEVIKPGLSKVRIGKAIITLFVQ